MHLRVTDFGSAPALRSQAEEAAIAEARLADPGSTGLQGRKLVALGVKIAAGTTPTESAGRADPRDPPRARTRALRQEGKVADPMLSGDFTCLPPAGADCLAEDQRGTLLGATDLAAHNPDGA